MEQCRKKGILLLLYDDDEEEKNVASTKMGELSGDQGKSMRYCSIAIE
jgi:hypothetical protein